MVRGVSGAWGVGGGGPWTHVQHVHQHNNRGEVKDLQVMEGRGFAFVTFTDFHSAQQFLGQRDHEIDRRRIDAKAAVPRNSGSGSQLTRKMFVGGTVCMVVQWFVVPCVYRRWYMHGCVGMLHTLGIGAQGLDNTTPRPHVRVKFQTKSFDDTLSPMASLKTVWYSVTRWTGHLVDLGSSHSGMSCLWKNAWWSPTTSMVVRWNSNVQLKRKRWQQ